MNTKTLPRPTKPTTLTRTRARIAALLQGKGFKVGQGNIQHKDGRSFFVAHLITSVNYR